MWWVGSRKNLPPGALCCALERPGERRCSPSRLDVTPTSGSRACVTSRNSRPSLSTGVEKRVQPPKLIQKNSQQKSEATIELKVGGTTRNPPSSLSFDHSFTSSLRGPAEI